MQSQSLKDYASESPKHFSRPSLIALLRLLAYSALGRFLVDCWEGKQMDANGIQCQSAVEEICACQIPEPALKHQKK